MCARDIELAKAAVRVAKMFDVAFMGLAGTCHQKAAEELDVPFIAGICFKKKTKKKGFCDSIRDFIFK